MSPSTRITAALALGLALTACGKTEAPADAAATDSAPAPALDEPKPADTFTTEMEASRRAVASEPSPPRSVVLAPNIPDHEDRRLRRAIAELNAAETGGPIDLSSEEASAERAFTVLYSYLEKQRLPTDTFYMKYSDEVNGYRYYMFFGIPREGEGLYVHVRLFPDGRAEIVD